MSEYLSLLSERAPGLAVVLVGEDPASQIYVRNKTLAARAAGIAVEDHFLAADTTKVALLALIEQLNRDVSVHGLLVQLPLPGNLDAHAATDDE